MDLTQYSTSTLALTGAAVVGAALLFSSRKKTPEKDTWEKHIQPHGSFKEIAPDLWMLTAFNPRGAPRNMTVWVLPNKNLLIHNCIAINEDTLKDLIAIGKPEIVIVPNCYHRMDIVVWKERFPDCKVICPKKAVNVHDVVKVEGYCEEELPKYGIKIHDPVGLKSSEFAYEIPLAKGKKALIVTDLVFNIPPEHGGVIARVLGGQTNGKDPRFSRITRYIYLTDKATLQKFMKDLADNNFDILVPGHGNYVVGDIKTKLINAANDL